MMTFWIFAAVLIAAALAILAPALLRSRAAVAENRNQQNVVIAQERLSELEADLANGVLDQQAFNQAKEELEQALLLDLKDEEAPAATEVAKGPGRIAMGIAAISIPALAVGLYLQIGTPQMLSPGTDDMVQQQGAAPTVEEMLSTLVERLKEKPDDSEGWYLLGRTYMMLKEYPKAVTSFEQLHKLIGDEPTVLLSLADALAMAGDGNMQGRPADLVRKAVELAPTDTTALWLAGMVEDQAGNHAKAVAYWERLEPMVQEDAESRQRVAMLLSKSRQKAGLPTPSAASATTAGAVAAAAEITLNISLAPELQQQVKGGESMFVYARPLEGPRMPLAAVRIKVSDLPGTVILSDAQAMTPQAKLSNFEYVLVGARISRGGDAIAASGDLKGEVMPVEVAEGTVVDLVIDTLVE
ncbi:MAG: c-type cytochrome biogenesis protein CcmI [Candidatus Sedimenticola sp. (ex Thyasira tokunagai)]